MESSENSIKCSAFDNVPRLSLNRAAYYIGSLEYITIQTQFIRMPAVSNDHNVCVRVYLHMQCITVYKHQRI